jgi:hypothetical protein
MFNPLHYIFYYTHYNANSIRRYNSRENAIVFICVIILFCTLPFIAKAVFIILGEKNSNIFYYTIVVYGIILLFLCKRYFERKEVFSKIITKYKKQSKVQVFIGRVVAWITLAASFLLFFILLSRL